jgi:hypothetical protein
LGHQNLAKRIAYIWLAMVMLLVPAAVLRPLPTQASPETDAWNKYPIPKEGRAGDWVLTGPGTSVTALGVAGDGTTIYAATEGIGNHNLYKSDDDGYTWTPLWEIPAGDGGSMIIAINLPDREDPETIYLATENNVYKSTDGGEDFSIVGNNPGSAGANGLKITSFDVIEHHGDNLLVISTRDVDNLEYGGVYFYDESETFGNLTDLRVGNSDAGSIYDALAVAFSPNFSDDEQIVAVVTDELNTIVTTRFGGGNWGDEVADAYIMNVLVDPPLPMAATAGLLAFPADYDSDVDEEQYVQYVGLDVGGLTGGVYLITGVEAPNAPLVDLVSLPSPVYSLDAAGNAIDPVMLIGEEYEPTVIGPMVVAGMTTGDVFSFMGGIGSPPPSAPPATNACVALGAFHGSGYYVYAGTSGTNGGFARSTDSGATFARTAFISDNLTEITDIAVSPVYDQDGTTYMITRGDSGNKILWRTTSQGQTWDAVMTQSQQLIDNQGSFVTLADFDNIVISRRFETDASVFIIESGSTPNIWRSTDNGARFSPLRNKATAEEIDSLVPVNNKKILVGDSMGNFYRTINGGRTWTGTVATGLSGFRSMVLSPDYDNDETILASDDSGQVYRSEDEGDTWWPPEDTAIGTGNTYVAFDPGYADNGTFYAASTDGSDLVVFRYTEEDEWQSIVTDGISNAATSGATGLACSPDGTLYVADGTAGGVFRCLNPTETEISEIEWSNAAEDIDTTNLDNLFLAGGINTLLGYNSATVWSYEDALTGEVALSSPDDGHTTGRLDSATLAWEPLGAAEGYDVRVNTEPGFDGMDYSPADTEVPTARVTGLENGQTYYWKVRVNDPTLSRWSETREFTTSLGAPQWNPFVGGVPESPANGANNVSLTPSFAWNPADWACGYEFVLARDAAFSDMVISKTGTSALSTTVYQCEETLANATTYYWKVRAVGKTSQSEWASAVFTTEVTPTHTPPPPTPPAKEPPPLIEPVFFWVIIGIMGALVITLLVLIFNTRRP